MIQWISLTLGFIVFAILHSYLAGHTFKKWLFSLLPGIRPFYRLLYNIFALITFWLWLLLLPSGGLMIYELSPPLNYLFYGIQLASIAGLYWATRSLDNSAFLGIKQVNDYFRNNQFPGNLDEPNHELTFHGAYRAMRHPLYTFVMLLLIFRPDVSLRWLILSLFCIVYFWIGSIYEERKLRTEFGDQYTRYQKHVPRFIPRLSNIL